MNSARRERERSVKMAHREGEFRYERRLREGENIQTTQPIEIVLCYLKPA